MSEHYTAIPKLDQSTSPTTPKSTVKGLVMPPVGLTQSAKFRSSNDRDPSIALPGGKMRNSRDEENKLRGDYGALPAEAMDQPIPLPNHATNSLENYSRIPTDKEIAQGKNKTPPNSLTNNYAIPLPNSPKMHDADYADMPVFDQQQQQQQPGYQTRLPAGYEAIPTAAKDSNPKNYNQPLPNFPTPQQGIKLPTGLTTQTRGPVSLVSGNQQPKVDQVIPLPNRSNQPQPQQQIPMQPQPQPTPQLGPKGEVLIPRRTNSTLAIQNSHYEQMPALDALTIAAPANNNHPQHNTQQQTSPVISMKNNQPQTQIQPQQYQPPQQQPQQYQPPPQPQQTQQTQQQPPTETNYTTIPLGVRSGNGKDISPQYTQIPTDNAFQNTPILNQQAAQNSGYTTIPASLLGSQQGNQQQIPPQLQQPIVMSAKSTVKGLVLK